MDPRLIITIMKKKSKTLGQVHLQYPKPCHKGIQNTGENLL